MNSGFSTQTQALLGFGVFFLVFGGWHQYLDSKRQVLINKLTSQIELTEFSFLGKSKHTTYSLDDFSSVQSYISRGKGARNIVELVTTDGNRGLLLSSFFPCCGKKFWSLDIETENSEAALLASKVTEFIKIKNMGFIGHKFVTSQLGIEKNAKFISNIF